MTSFPTEVWALLAVIAVGAVLAVLHTLATVVRNQTFVHETRLRVSYLKRRYARELEGVNDAEVYEDVIVLPEPPAKAAA